MKIIGWLFFVAMICFSIWQMSSFVSTSPTTEQWIATEATVLDTRSKTKRRATNAYAKVSFTATDGNTYETEVKLLAIPFIGTTLSVNDTISILYNAEKPMIAKSVSANFIETYGLYILIGLGVVLSFFYLQKALKKVK